LLSLICLSIFGSDKKDMKTGIIYGSNFAYSLTAPEGWVLDNTSGVQNGLDAVFYKKGGSWAKSVAVMYTNTASLEDNAHRSLDLLMKYDVNEFMKNYPDMHITNGKDIILRNNKIAKVKYLFGKTYKNYEAVAYIDAGKNCIMIVISSKNKDEYDKSLQAFESIVKSYLYITDKVQRIKK